MDHGYQGRKLVCVFRTSHIKELSEKTTTNLLSISEAIILCLTMSFAQFYHAHASVTITVDIFKHIIIGYYCDEFARYSISEFSLHITYINHWAKKIDHTVIILYRTILLFAIIFVVYCYSSIVVVIQCQKIWFWWWDVARASCWKQQYYNMFGIHGGCQGEHSWTPLFSTIWEDPCDSIEFL